MAFLDTTSTAGVLASMDKTLHSAGHLRLVQLLVDARRKAKLTQVELAQRLGRRQPFVSNYESGQRRIDVIEFVAICEALDVRPSVVLRRWERNIGKPDTTPTR